jgi:flagellar basal body rod protein FlgC
MRWSLEFNVQCGYVFVGNMDELEEMAAMWSINTGFMAVLRVLLS